MRKFILALIIVLLAASTAQATIFMEWRADERFQYTLQGEYGDELVSWVEGFTSFFEEVQGLNEFRIQEAIAAPYHVMVFIDMEDLEAYSNLVNDPEYQAIAGKADYYHTAVNIHLWTRAPWAPETLYGNEELKGKDTVVLYIRANLNPDYAFVQPQGEELIGWAAGVVEQWAGFPGVVEVSSHYLLAAGWQTLFTVRFEDLESWKAFQNDEDVKAARLDMRKYFDRIKTELWEPFHVTPESVIPVDVE